MVDGVRCEVLCRFVGNAPQTKVSAASGGERSSCPCLVNRDIKHGRVRRPEKPGPGRVCQLQTCPAQDRWCAYLGLPSTLRRALTRVSCAGELLVVKKFHCPMSELSVKERLEIAQEVKLLAHLSHVNIIKFYDKCVPAAGAYHAASCSQPLLALLFRPQLR